MDKRGAEQKLLLWAFYLILVAIIVVGVVFAINNRVKAASITDKFIAIDISLIRDTIALSPGKLNLNYNYGNRDIEIDENKIKSNKISFAYIPDMNKDLLIRESKDNLRLRNLNFAFPVSQRVVTSCFGNRNIIEGTNNHRGIDLRANYENVVAVANGLIESYINGLGTENSLTIKHEEGVKTRYLHLDKIEKNIKLDNNFNCIENCEVKKGEIIAISGQHGPRSNTQYDPHLHFELVIDGIPRDPINYIFDPENFYYKENSNCFNKDNLYAYNYGGNINNNKIT